MTILEEAKKNLPLRMICIAAAVTVLCADQTRSHLFSAAQAHLVKSLPLFSADQRTKVREAFLLEVCRRIGGRAFPDQSHLKRLQILQSIKTNAASINQAIDATAQQLGACSGVDGLRLNFEKGYSIDTTVETLSDHIEPLYQLTWRGMHAAHLEKRGAVAAARALQIEHPSALFSLHVEPADESKTSKTHIGAENQRENQGDIESEELIKKHLDIGQDFNSINPFIVSKNQRVSVASLIKLSYLEHVTANVLNENLKWNSLVSGKSLENVTRRMIKWSDNSATDELTSYLSQLRYKKSAENKNSTLLAESTKVIFGVKYALPEIYQIFFKSKDSFLRKISVYAAAQSEPFDYCKNVRCAVPNLDSKLNWQQSAAEVCAALKKIWQMQEPVSLGILSENTSLVDEKVSRKMKYIGFKGGRDLGVMSAAFLFQPKAALNASSMLEDTKPLCAVAVWNDKTQDVPHAKFAFLVNELLSEALSRDNKTL